MRTSGSTDFILNRNQIIEKALRAASIRGAGLTPSSDDIDTCSDVFNMMLSDWQMQRINVALLKDIIVFPRYGVAEYPLGPYGFDAAEFYYQTTLNGDHSEGDTSISLTSNLSDVDGICVGQTVAPSICGHQQMTEDGALVLGGTLVSGGVAVLPEAATISILSDDTESDVVFTIVGTDSVGSAQTETVTVSTADTHFYTTNQYKTVTSVSSSAATTGHIVVNAPAEMYLNGAVCSGGVASLPTPSKISFFSTETEKTVIFTITGRDENGSPQSEEITLTSEEYYLSANKFKTISSISVASSTAGSINIGYQGIMAGDFAIIEMDDATAHRDVVSSAEISSQGCILSLSTAYSGLPSDASDGNAIFFYRSNIPKPIDIISVRSYSLNGLESALTRYEGKSEYVCMSVNKSSVGTPTSYFYDPGADTGTLYLYPTPSDVTTVYKCQARMPIEDMDSSSQNAYFPREWMNALVLNLAVAICPYFSKEPSQFLFAQAKEALFVARRSENHNRSFRIIPHISR